MLINQVPPWILLLYLLHRCSSVTSKVPSFISEYIDQISTFDKPITLRKHYGMQQSSIDFYPGTMNIIFSVPHDGDLKSNLLKRPKGACRKVNSTSKKCYHQHPCLAPKFRLDATNCKISQGRDVNTRLLALALRYEFYQRFQLTPFVIINRLERSKVDMNRFIDEGTFGVRETMHAWMRYHFYLKHARELILHHPYNYAGKGVLFDLHSQDHQEGWTELGYMLTSRQLASPNYPLKSSSLASYLATLFDPKELIHGKKSLGYFLTNYRYAATPSPAHPSPPVQSYYEWGYTIEEYGRHSNFSAIMIESPFDELVNQTRLFFYAKALASALHDYLIELEILEPLITLEMPKARQQCNRASQWLSERCIFLWLLSLILLKLS